MSKILIITWVVMDGSEATDQKVLRDGYYRTVYKTIPKARAATWSTDLSQLESGKSYAKTNGYTLRIMDDTDDALEKARQLALKEYKGT
jgi:hypothetical protein